MSVRSWILLTLYMIALGRPLAPILDYQVNRDYFVEVLCINKSKPELNCNGKCALELKLKQSYKDETLPVSAPGIVKLDDYPIGFVTFYNKKFQCESLFSNDHHAAPIGITMQGYDVEIPHPPCIS